MATPVSDPSVAPMPAFAGLSFDPVKSLGEDPAWLAYSRSLGLQNGLDETGTAQQAGLLESRLPGDLADINRRADYNLRNTRMSYEGRGVAGGGEENRSVRIAGEDRARALADREASVANNIVSLYSALASRVANRATVSADRALSSAYNLSVGGI